MSNFGFVYILRSYDENDLFKIGYTKMPPSHRLEQINATAPASKGFRLFCYAEFENARKEERFLHKHLQNFRIPSTELFRGKDFIFVSYLYKHQNWSSFCPCDCQSDLLMPLDSLPDPYEEMGYVF